MYYPDLKFESAGTNLNLCRKLGTNPLSEDVLANADLILVMEEKHRKAVLGFSQQKLGNRIRVLNIPDRYEYYESTLIQLLIDRCSNLLPS